MKVILKNLSKYYGQVKAVDNLNLEIGDGEFVALLGPSGCGKTTTLLTIAGIYRPTGGLIYFDDRVVNDVLSKDRQIGMVFQSYALYPHMTVFNNIGFPLKLMKVKREEIRERVTEVARLVRIEELLERKPGQLSGGQQQRVALCRALVREPEILLLDEPLSNLDARLRVMMRSELKRLQKELGITAIFVTHDQLEALDLADKVAVFDAGHLQQFGTPEELYNNPQNLFVAGFIGTPPMSFFDVSYEQAGGRMLLRSADFALELPAAMGARVARAATSAELVLGIRPEHVTITGAGGDGAGAGDAGSDGDGDRLDAVVYVVESQGREILVSAQRGEAMFKVLTVPPFTADMGDRITLRINREKIVLYDRRTGDSLLQPAGAGHPVAAPPPG